MAVKPGGVVTVEPGEVLVAVGARDFEREGRVGAGGVAREAASKLGSNGRAAPGHGAPPGPRSRVKNWVEVCVPRLESQGVKVLVTG